MGDKWMNIGFEDDELLPYLEPVYDINDQTRIQKMIQMGYNVHDIQESLADNRYDELCATYMLLGSQMNLQSLSHPSSSSLSPINVGDPSSLTPNSPNTCLLYTSPSPRDRTRSRMPSSA